MKKLLFLLLLCTVAFGSTAYAQQPTDNIRRGQDQDRDPAARTAQMVAEMTEGLQLSADQADQLTVILNKSAAKRASLRDQGRTGDREARREQMKTLMQETDTAIEAILDKKQLRRYENMKKQRRENRPERGGRPGGRGPRGGK